MDPLFFLYAIIVFVLAVGAFFIVYHILRYSLSDTLGYFGAGLFSLVFLALLLLNVVSYQSLEPQLAVPTLDMNSLLQSAPTTITPAKNSPW